MHPRYLLSKPRRVLWCAGIALALLMSGRASAQLTVTSNLTAQQLVQELVGENVEIQNPVLTCPAGHSGKFVSAGSNLNIPGGIILCTGYAATTSSQVGVNGPKTFSVGTSGLGSGDPQMSLVCGANTNNACILEFDFIPDVDSTSTLSFRYSFGSEEYTSFTCSPFNDAFAFLLTGGPYSNTNIALVPNTTIPVAVNSINSGVPSGGYQLSTCNALGPGSPFPQYFNNNNGGTTVAFDGFTTVLEARAVVQPCSTYHIRLGVANAVDGALQSGVFLERNSFSVDSVKLDLDGFIASSDGYLVEGCTPAVVTASRTEVSNRRKKICLDYLGTATNGVDYPFLADTLVIPPGQLSATLTINPYMDGISEPGFETIKIRRVNCCTHNPIDSLVIQVRDSLELKLLSQDTLTCPGQPVRLQVSGDPLFSLLWTSSINDTGAHIVKPTDSFTTARPVLPTYFTVTAKYKTCPDVQRSFKVDHEPFPVVNILLKEQVLCMEDSVTINVGAVQPDSFRNYTYSWAPPDYLSDTKVLEPRFFNPNYADQWYVLTASTPIGCKGADSTFLHTRPPFTLTNLTASQTIFYGDSIMLNADGAKYYTWTPPLWLNDPNSKMPWASPKERTLYTVYGLNQYGCRDTGYVTIDINYTMSEFIPNAFTPNGDGRNDVFRLTGIRFQELQEFRVFNRWGEQVFSTINPEAGWDGTFNGKPAEIGTYTYLIRVALPDGTARRYKGDVLLLR